MGLADELRKMHTPTASVPQEERIAQQIFIAIKKSAGYVVNARRLQGYYCSGYDEPEIVSNIAQASIFLYEDDYQKQYQKYGERMARNKDYLLDELCKRDAPTKICNSLRAILRAEGFVNPQIRAEDTVAKVYYDSGILIKRYYSLAGFAIYIDISW